MEFHKDSKVYASDGKDIGRVSRVVIDPVTKKVTHLVVSEGMLGSDLVLGTDLVTEASEDRVQVSRRADELENLPPFEVQHYVSAGSGNEARSTGPRPLYWYPLPPMPDGFGAAIIPPPSMGFPVVERSIPEDSIPLREGAQVTAEDGKHVGNVDEVVVDPRSKRYTHFVITKGLIFHERKLVPSAWIDRITEDEVHLAVSTEVLESVREYRNGEELPRAS